jgi:hypothetical protein
MKTIISKSSFGHLQFSQLLINSAGNKRQRVSKTHYTNSL